MNPVQSIIARDFREAVGQLVHGTIQRCAKCRKYPDLHWNQTHALAQCDCVTLEELIGPGERLRAKSDALLAVAKEWMKRK